MFFFKKAGGLSLDRHLFLMMLEEVSLSELPIFFFYRSMLLAWRTVFRVERDVDDQGFWTPVEPLFF